MTIRFVTTNPGKVREAREYLAEPVEQLDFDTPEIQSADLGAIAAHKARAAYEYADGPVFVDDAGLFIDAFDGFPGPYSSYVHDTVGVERVWRLTSDEEDRAASFRGVVAYCDGEEFEATPEPVDRDDRDEERSPNERAGSEATRERRGQDLSADDRAAATTDEQVRSGEEEETLPVKLFYGVVPGEIVEPRGDGGFGYDPIFEYDDRTFAEMDSEEKNAVSHRGRALAKFADWLAERDTVE
ncbi:non-canonical purine NTP pyrophosphatase [Halosimplex salinum]|uniref:non-canonical purine NTP pyrophosphatase n=1 Tax=Halosimplex salinum TaxID=1710538 RepID=UPI000F4ACBA0|nr:non-canonical purine NTP pyrophosphatase [Halosimplex salinum]